MSFQVLDRGCIGLRCFMFLETYSGRHQLQILLVNFAHRLVIAFLEHEVLAHILHMRRSRAAVESSLLLCPSPYRKCCQRFQSSNDWVHGWFLSMA